MTSSIALQETYVFNNEARRCPYAGKKFDVRIEFPEKYPFENPKVCSPAGYNFNSVLSVFN